MDFQNKIYELIRSDQSTHQTHKANFILELSYHYNKESNTFQSEMVSLWNNLMNKSLYNFPKFFRILANETTCTIVINNLLQKYAPNSRKINKKINENYSEYLYHFLTYEEIEIITAETYEIYCKIQNFLQNLSKDHKNWIAILEDHYLEAESLSNPSFELYSRCFNIYYEKYKLIPKLNFNNVLLNFMNL